MNPAVSNTLIIGFIVAAAGIIYLMRELMRVKYSQQTIAALQLAQRLRDPQMQESINIIRFSTYSKRSMPDYAQNGSVSGALPANISYAEREKALRELCFFLSLTGSMAKRKVASADEIFFLMGETISQTWSAMRQTQSVGKTILSGEDLQNFLWLYTEWLNYSHRRNAEMQSAQSAMPEYSAIKSPKVEARVPAHAK